MAKECAAACSYMKCKKCTTQRASVSIQTEVEVRSSSSIPVPSSVPASSSIPAGPKKMTVEYICNRVRMRVHFCKVKRMGCVLVRLQLMSS